jgi:hypothetical protein
VQKIARLLTLYAVEKTIRGQSAEERRAVRQDRSKPLVLALKARLEHQLNSVSVKASIADQIRYGFNHRDGLTRFSTTPASSSIPTSSSAHPP